MRFLRVVASFSRYTVASRRIFLTAVLVAITLFLGGVVFIGVGHLGAGAIGLVASVLSVLIGLSIPYLVSRRPVVRAEGAKSMAAPPAFDLAKWRNPVWASECDQARRAQSPLEYRENGVDGTIDLLDRRSSRDKAVQVHHSDAEGVDVWMVPSARYHIGEMGPVASELEAAGLRVAFVTSRSPSPALVNEAARWNSSVELWSEDWARRPAVVFTLNDWGMDADLLRWARAGGSKIVSKVEGAQDFRNVDTPRWQFPYTNSDLVLVQGAFDAEHVQAEKIAVVGSSRIERVIELTDAGRLEAPVRPFVANLNFSYGAYGSAAPSWFRKVQSAATRSDASLHMNLHPAVQAPFARGFESPWPLALDLETSHSLVTRCSTALFDALAMGRDVAYFNPHGEKVWSEVPWTPDVPEVRSTAELADSISNANAGRALVAKRRFLQEVFISVTTESSAKRTSREIANLV